MINIVVTEQKENHNFIQASELYSYIKPGEFYQIYTDGFPHQTYYFMPDLNEKLISVWYNTESCKWNLAVGTEMDIEGYLSHVKAKKVNADLSLVLKVS